MNRLTFLALTQVFATAELHSAFKMLLGLCMVLGIATATPLSAQEDAANPITTFLVVRHAERDGNKDKLTMAGEQRAQLLASLGSALNVQAIYSTNTKRTKGTAQPLANSVNTEIKIYDQPSKEWIGAVKEKHLGHVVLIVGHSNTAGVIAGMLANQQPYEIAHDEYDALFLIQISGSGTQAMRLRYGSSSEGAPAADPDKMGKLQSANPNGK